MAAFLISVCIFYSVESFAHIECYNDFRAGEAI